MILFWFSIIAASLIGGLAGFVNGFRNGRRAERIDQALSDADALYGVAENQVTRLRAWMNYNSTDMGELGKFIRLEYALNGIREMLR